MVHGSHTGEIPFTEYVKPNGRKRETIIVRSMAVCDKANDIMAAGYDFEVELLTTGDVSLTITNEDGDADIEVVENAPGGVVGNAVDRLVRRFPATLQKEKVNA